MSLKPTINEERATQTLGERLRRLAADPKLADSALDLDLLFTEVAELMDRDPRASRPRILLCRMANAVAQLGEEIHSLRLQIAAQQKLIDTLHGKTLEDFGDH